MNDISSVSTSILIILMIPGLSYTTVGILGLLKIAKTMFTRDRYLELNEANRKALIRLGTNTKV